MADRRMKKAEKTRRTIVETGMALFKEQGVENTSMESIAAACDIAKGTLYNHFHCKEAIIASYMRQKFSGGYFEETFREAETMRDRLRVVLKSLGVSINENQEIFERYLVYQMQHLVSFEEKPTLESGFKKIGDYIIEKGLESGEIQSALPKLVLREFFEFIFIEMVKQIYKMGVVEDALVEAHIDLFMSGVTKA
ncbi:MAG: TetR/AcrR family transcriptional regulator [Clostridia bacterium]|nr:TetR/AcrR family transcriptional regulator [Clostridia bacterium]